MESRTFNPDGAPTVLFVLGYGNRLAGASVRWAIDRVTEAGYRVHAVSLPIEGTDFEEAYREPVQSIHDEEDPDVLLGHSLGGLVGPYLRTEARPVYLSPWWGMYPGKVARWERWLIPKLPIRVPILPTKTSREEMGALLSGAEWEQVPKRLSPVFISEIYRAQRQRPPVDPDAAVFVTLSDTIIDLEAVGEAVGSDQIHLYDGAHQLFSSAGRAAAMDAVVSALGG